MTRLLRNFLNGDLDSSVSDTDTTLSSPGFADLPVVSSPDVMALVLDPTGSGNGPEIVTVTDHADGATTVTVTRGEESTTAASHASGTSWIHAVTQDYLTSGNALGGSAADSTAVAVHPNASANSADGVAIGDGAVASGSSRVGIAIGAGASADASGSYAGVAIGLNASANTQDTVAIGHGASASRSDVVAIGRNASDSGASGSICIGENAASDGDESVVVGRNATRTGWSGGATVSIGSNASGDSEGVAIGMDASGSDRRTIAIGRNASADHDSSNAIGNGVATSAANQHHFGARHLALDEVTDPATPPADEGRLYFRDDGAGTTELVALFPSGNSTVLATGAA